MGDDGKDRAQQGCSADAPEPHGAEPSVTRALEAFRLVWAWVHGRPCQLTDEEILTKHLVKLPKEEEWK